jgi:hypothetical protein
VNTVVMKNRVTRRSGAMGLGNGVHDSMSAQPVET